MECIFLKANPKIESKPVHRNKCVSYRYEFLSVSLVKYFTQCNTNVKFVCAKSKEFQVLQKKLEKLEKS